MRAPVNNQGNHHEGVGRNGGITSHYTRVNVELHALTVPPPPSAYSGLRSWVRCTPTLVTFLWLRGFSDKKLRYWCALQDVDTATFLNVCNHTHYDPAVHPRRPWPIGKTSVTADSQTSFSWKVT